MKKRAGITFAFGTILMMALLTVRANAALDEDHKEKINGTTLHFRVRGADKGNPYLLILHGGPGFSAHMFYPWGPTLEKTLNVVYLDQRGCGESARYNIADLRAPKPEEIKDLTVSHMVQDCEGVREFLKVDKWYVLGHSWGGMLGLEVVAAHPEHVLGYIHMDGLVSFVAMQEAMLDGAEARFKQQAQSDDKTKKTQAELLLKQVAQLRALPPDNLARVFSAFQLALGPAQLYFASDQAKAFVNFQNKIREAAQVYKVEPASLAQASEPVVALMHNDKLSTRDVQPLLAKITVPTLILNGKQDGVITPMMAEQVQKAIKNAQLVLLDNCGHFPFAEQPERATAAILEFVKAPAK